MSADYPPAIYSSANPPDRVFGANREPSRVQKTSFKKKRKPSRESCVSADYHPTIDLSANPPNRVLTQTVNPPGRVCVFADYHPTIDPTIDCTST